MAYQKHPTEIPDVWVLQPQVFGDSRGFFLESFNQRDFHQVTGLNLQFVQDNHSRSAKGVLRGLHFQVEKPQGKLVRVVQGAVLDVAVDLRPGSATLGRHVARVLSAENQAQMWIPPGFAHGFLVLSDSADFLYKTTEYWQPEFERSLAWDDPDLNIDWRLAEYQIDRPILAAKDAVAGSWKAHLNQMG
jgi:dTDP-4-dehydrorhamnose 3,5-epimerase